MRLSARFYDDVTDVNHLRPTDRVRFHAGDTVAVTLQLIDLNLDTGPEGFNPPGRPYHPVAGATLQVTMESVDSARTVQRAATQPFAANASFWRFSVGPLDQLRGTITLTLRLTQSGVVTTGVVPAALLASSGTCSD